jgi:sulfatase modifying factor 1
MLGNVLEWTADFYDEHYYATRPANDPKGPRSGKYHTLRGGAFYNIPELVRVSYRARTELEPVRRVHDVGVRCVGE